MKIRLKDRPEVTGWSGEFNVHSISEVLVGFDGDGGADSCFIRDLEVWIEGLGWKCMRQAFKDRDIINDKYNTHFREPQTCEEIERGWY